METGSNTRRIGEHLPNRYSENYRCRTEDAERAVADHQAVDTTYRAKPVPEILLDDRPPCQQPSIESTCQRRIVRVRHEHAIDIDATNRTRERVEAEANSDSGSCVGRRICGR